MSEKEIKEVVTVVLLTVWAVLLIAVAHTVLTMLGSDQPISLMAVVGYLLSVAMFLLSIDTFLNRDKS